eukprot:TRINITY_DN14848_c0_g2_i2.p1 TRINITY_DN14848_c0_g2~~TRINITY_DN14848_c0_g2_i2.p1  ORF type:complete len:118 (-),score=12.27 TRINITY_DN14848_c0_g2_i2:177-530(-)
MCIRDRYQRRVHGKYGHHCSSKRGKMRRTKRKEISATVEFDPFRQLHACLPNLKTHIPSTEEKMELGRGLFGLPQMHDLLAIADSLIKTRAGIRGSEEGLVLPEPDWTRRNVKTYNL